MCYSQETEARGPKVEIAAKSVLTIRNEGSEATEELRDFFFLAFSEQLEH